MRPIKSLLNKYHPPNKNDHTVLLVCSCHRVREGRNKSVSWVFQRRIHSKQCHR